MNKSISNQGKTLSKKNRLTLVITISLAVLLITAIFGFQRDFARAIFVLILILFWVISSLKLKNVYNGSLLTLLLAFPFNVTIQLPYSFDIVSLTLNLTDPYVHGALVNYLIPTVSVIDLFLAISLVCVWLEHRKELVSDTRIKKILMVVLGILTFALIQFLSTNEFIVLFNWGRVLLFLTNLFAVIILFRQIVDAKFKKLILGSFLLLTLLQGFLGIAQFARGADLGLQFLGESELVTGVLGVSFADIAGNIYLRAYGTFPHPNVFAGFMLVAFYVGFARLLSVWKTQSKKNTDLFSSLLLLFPSFFIMFSMSRSAIVALAIGWVGIVFTMISAWLQATKMVFKKRLNSFIPALLFERLFSSPSGDFSYSDRVELIKKAWEILLKNPFSGVGLGLFTKVLGEDPVYTSGGFRLLQPVHNIFILFSSETGIIFGGGLSLLFIFSSMKTFLRTATKFKPFFVCLTLSLLTIGMLDHYLITLPQGLIMTSFFILALMVLREG